MSVEQCHHMGPMCESDLERTVCAARKTKYASSTSGSTESRILVAFWRYEGEVTMTGLGYAGRGV